MSKLNLNYNPKDKSEYKRLIKDIYTLATTSNVSNAQKIYENILSDCETLNVSFIKTIQQGLIKAKSLCCGIIDTSRFVSFQKDFNK